MKNSFVLKFGVLVISAATVLSAASCTAKYSESINGGFITDSFDNSSSYSFEYSGGSIAGKYTADGKSNYNTAYDFDTADSNFKSEVYPSEYADDSDGSIEQKYGERKIIYSSWYNISTEEYDKSVDMLNGLCEKYGAYYENAESYGGDRYSDRYAHFTVRIPKDNYNSFIKETGGIGTVTSSGENNREVTEQYFDAEARLESARLREERLLKILENAASLDDVLSLERELADVRYEIENYSGTLKKFDSLISYSTADITINEVVKVVLPDSQRQSLGERMSQAVSRGFDSFRDGLSSLLVELSYQLPVLLFVWLPLLIVAVVIVIIVVGKRKKKKKQNLIPEADEKADSDK